MAYYAIAIAITIHVHRVQWVVASAAYLCINDNKRTKNWYIIMNNIVRLW